jgi:hypothetical protein
MTAILLSYSKHVEMKTAAEAMRICEAMKTWGGKLHLWMFVLGAAWAKQKQKLLTKINLQSGSPNSKALRSFGLWSFGVLTCSSVSMFLGVLYACTQHQ